MELGWIELGKTFGFPALIFAIWYIYHLGETKKWETAEMLERERWESLLAQIRKEHEQHFTLLKETLDDIKIFAAAVRELKDDIKHFKETVNKCHESR